MATAFIPSGGGGPDTIIANDGWFPDLDTADFKSHTAHGDTFGAERLAAALTGAMIEINTVLRDWRAATGAARLADVPAPVYGTAAAAQSEKIILYRAAVFARARAQLLDTTRDYDTTRDGHTQADKLEDNAATWMQISHESLSRLMDRPRAVVELI